MKLTLEQVHHVAKLARLHLTEAEERAHQAQLQQVLDAFQALEALDTKDVPPTHHVNLEPTELRDDVPEAPLPVEQALANAPERAGTSFAVPKVIE